MNWPELQRGYDIVGLDPRGVGGSSPVRCDTDVLFAPYPEMPRDDKEFAQLAEHNRKVAESCRALTGPLVDFVDSASVARDMDVIRAALGEKKLNYFGRSYGTLAGQQYAELFGPNVGRMLLDSNMDHSLPNAWQFMRSRALTVEESFGQFVAWRGRNTASALHGQDVKKVHADLLARAESGELTVPGSNPPSRLTPQQFLVYVTRGRARRAGARAGHHRLALRPLGWASYRGIHRRCVSVLVPRRAGAAAAACSAAPAPGTRLTITTGARPGPG